MTRLRIVRSNGSWFIQDDKGNQRVHKFFKTLEEAREAAKSIKEAMITPVKKETKDDTKGKGRIRSKK